MIDLARRADRPPVVVSPHRKVIDAARLMRSEGVRALVVVDEDRPVGIVSEHDFVTRLACERLDPAATTVDQIMTPTPITISRNETTAAALAVMQIHHVQHLPVVDDEGKLVTLLELPCLEEAEIDELEHEVASLEAWAAYDGGSG